jgi:hypothetical protein
MKKVIDEISIIEKDLILKGIEKKFLISNRTIDQADRNEIDAISYNLLITNGFKI